MASFAKANLLSASFPRPCSFTTLKQLKMFRLLIVKKKNKKHNKTKQRPKKKQKRKNHGQFVSQFSCSLEFLQSSLMTPKTSNFPVVLGTIFFGGGPKFFRSAGNVFQQIKTSRLIAIIWLIIISTHISGIIYIN